MSTKRLQKKKAAMQAKKEQQLKKKPETATTYFKTSPADVRNPSKSFFP